MRMICRRTAIVFAFVWLAGFTVMVAPHKAAGSPEEIDFRARETLDQLFWKVRGSRELIARSAAVLVFPRVYKAGFGFGGEYGEGALIHRDRIIDYYNTVSASFGFQLGAQARSVVIAFMTPEALDAFRAVNGWKVGVDGSVALITVGGGASIDTARVAEPVVGFIFDNKGLMYNLTLEGSKISRIYPY
jgi:lipid-binding SYLF domain-containing protein